MKITREQFESYEEVRVSGETNMFDIKTVSELSGLDREVIIFIMDHYDELKETFKEDLVSAHTMPDYTDISEDEVEIETNNLSDMQGVVMDLGDIFKQQPKRRSISDHYGVKEEELIKFVEDMFVFLIKERGEKTKLIDKYFANLNGEQRVQIVAMTAALHQYEIYNQMLEDYNRGYR